MQRLLLLLVLLAPSFASCRALGLSNSGPLRLETVPGYLADIDSSLEAGDALDALDRLERVNRTANIEPADRVRADRQLDVAMEAAVSGLHQGVYDSADLSDIFGLELPTRARARAGVEAAFDLASRDHPVAAYKMARKVEFALPAHPERQRAGDLLQDVGFEMVERDDNYFWIFSYRQRGIEALEFLVSRYPFHPSCEEAYRKLSVAYERVDDLDRAIERLSDLLVYHPDTSFRGEAEARLATLRLKRIELDEYDRSELVRARDELAAWLDRFSDHPLREDVFDTLDDAHVRLAQSDMSLARYYARIDVARGVQLHATRAIDEAGRSRLERHAETVRTLVADAERLIAEHPIVEGEDDGEVFTPLVGDDLEVNDPLGPNLMDK